MTELTLDGASFSKFAMLYLDETGRFIDAGDPDRDEARLVEPDELDRFLKRTVALPNGVTDVFVWVHGWQNDELRAVSTAKRMFANLADWLARERAGGGGPASLRSGISLRNWGDGYLKYITVMRGLVQAFTIPSSLSSASVKGRFFFWVRCDRLSCGGMVLK